MLGTVERRNKTGERNLIRVDEAHLLVTHMGCIVDDEDTAGGQRWSVAGGGGREDRQETTFTG